MKHLFLILFTVFVVYFAWQYAPQRPKFFVKQFLGRHFLIVAAIVIGAIAGLFFQTVSHSTKLI